MKRNKGRYTDRQGKTRVSVWIQAELLKELTIEAKDRGITRQSILESALRDRFRPIPREDYEALIARRLNRQDARIKRLEQRVEILAESFAMYLRMWLMSSPEVPEAQREAAVMQARERYDRYLKAVGKKVRTGQTIFTELEEDADHPGRGETG